VSKSQQHAPGAAGETIRPVAELFTTAAIGFWATTYSIDLALFTEFLLDRLGEPPLNIAILADHHRLSASLARVPADRADTLASANRRWLLRGASLGGQAFHPKSYLVVTASRAALFVGSGNLTVDGIDAGDELFTVFRSGTPAGDAALGTWRAWMRRLIEMTGDPVLADRFRDLDARLPRPTAAAVTGSPLLHNLDAPIASQLADRVRADGRAVDELLLAAPFYDHDAAAVGDLLGQLAPARVRVFVTSSTSVNGALLAGRLASSGAAVTVSGYEPDRFVHAKLIGVISGTNGWLVSGSPNLSQAALSRTVADNGNAELAVVATCTPTAARAAFIPPGTEVTESNLTDLEALSFRADTEPGLPAVRLLSAASTADGHITLVSDPPPSQAGSLMT